MNSTHLYVCGTYAFSPTCAYIVSVVIVCISVSEVLTTWDFLKPPISSDFIGIGLLLLPSY